MWNIKISSIPHLDPIDSIIDYSFEYKFILNTLSNLSYNLPNLIEDRKIREELIFELRGKKEIINLISSSKDRYLNERIYQIYCFFANSYINALYEKQSNRLPFEIAFPLLRISKKINRKPFLSYHSYCLYNWNKINKEGSFTYDNLELIQKFTTDKEEKSFIINLLLIQSKFDEVIISLNNNKFINYNDYKILLDLIYNFLISIDIPKPTDKYKSLMASYDVVLENCYSKISNLDKSLFLIILEVLFYNIEFENFNLPFSHFELLKKTNIISDKFNRYLINEKKYKDCKEILNDIILNLSWK